MATLLSGLKTQAMTMIPQLIETAEPQIEVQLRKTLQQIKATNPKESQLFLTNWKKLDKVVQQELVDNPLPLPTLGGKKKKTQKLKRYKKRT